MEGTDAAAFAGNDFGIGRNESSEQIDIFVIYFLDIIDAKMAILLFWSSWSDAFSVVIHSLGLKWYILNFYFFFIGGAGHNWFGFVGRLFSDNISRWVAVAGIVAGVAGSLRA